MIVEHEIWKAIPGYEGLYEASTLGRIRSVYRYQKVLKPMISNRGYERVDLFKEKHRKQHSVHRLVAITFLCNPFCKPEVNHIDENKRNNRLENLEWVTRNENESWGTKHQRAAAHTDYKTRRKRTDYSTTEKPISQFSISGEYIRSWKSASECAREMGFSNVSNIRLCARGKRKTAYGFIFREER